MDKMIKRSCILLVFLMTVALFGQIQKENLTVRGNGQTRQAAIEDALIQAAGQRYGMQISSQKQSLASNLENSNETTTNADGNVVDRINDYLGTVVEDNSSMTTAEARRIQSSTGGFIRNYEVMSTDQVDDHIYEAVVRVVFPKYKSPGLPTKRRRIAIFPFWTDQPGYVVQGQIMDAYKIQNAIRGQLEDGFTKTRKFAVLDREHMAEYQQEKGLLLSGDSPIEELCKVGLSMGVDYMLVGKILEAEVKEKNERFQATGKTKRWIDERLTVEYRIIVMATRQIKWSDTMTIKNERKIKKDKMPGPSETIRILGEKCASRILKEALAGIYPIRVIAKKNQQLILNQGTGNLHVGDLYEVYNRGEKMIDPYTKETLGTTEEWVAQIEIIRIAPKMSYADVIKGSLEAIEIKAICRPNDKGTRLKNKPRIKHIESDVKLQPQGGVRMPFD